MQIYIPPGPRLGDVVVEFEGVSKAYGDRLLFEDLSFTTPARRDCRRHRAERRGQDDVAAADCRRRSSPTRARLRIGQTVELGYVDQSRDTLAGDKSVWEEISGAGHADSARAR
jgi:energy-dependent translational throttle protein EttA